MSKVIPIKCKSSENYDIKEFTELQGDLKTLSDDSYNMLKESIIKFGFRFPIFYVELNNKKFILDGHGRSFTIKKMIEDGYSFGKSNKLPAVKIDADTRKEAKEVLLALNSKYGEMTSSGLSEFMASDGIDIKDIESFFKPIEFSLEEFKVDFEFKDDFVAPEIDEAIEYPDRDNTYKEDDTTYDFEVVKPIIKTGDVIELGKHRLMCGDSQDSLDVAILFKGNRADLLFTDPPYNYAEKNKLVGSDVSSAMQGLKDAKWDVGFNAEIFLNLIKEFLAENNTIYVCTSHHLAPEIWKWMESYCGFYSYCVYSKINPMPSLMKRHWTWDSELVCYGTKGKHVFNFPEDGHACSTWRLNKSQKNDLHPTQKPLSVPKHAIVHSSNPGQIVADMFGGSGSTLIACEQLDRMCYTMEKEPKYAQVIIQRYVDTTGCEEITINSVKTNWNDYLEKLEAES